MDRKTVLNLGAVAVAAALLAPSALHAQEGDPYTLETMYEYNGGLKALWMDIEIEQIELLTLSDARSSSRLRRQPFRWVPGDPRRGADVSSITYTVHQGGLSSSGLDATSAETAIDSAMASWASSACFSRTGVVKRPDTGADPDIFDGLLGYGGFGDYRIAQIVHAGWMPPSFFDEVAGEGSGKTVLALSVTFIYVGADGQPTDLDNDHHLDTAANEIYYNEGFAWLLDGGGRGSSSIDLESVALHEIGHSLGIGHIDEALDAVMNPVYSGAHRKLESPDVAALCSIWSRWSSFNKNKG